MLTLIAAQMALSQSRVPKIEDAVVYEANFRALGPSGGFNELRQRLDAIQKLGANVLWLMPVYPVGQIKSAGGLGSPYAVADYEALNPEFGTEQDFKALIDEAHRRNIAVILDWVPNHTAWDNPWVKQHSDWYTKNEKGEMVPPAGTNWQDVADLDYSKPELRSAMIAAMKSWIDRYGIDGYRVDAADWVPIDFWKEAIPSLRRGSPRPLFMLAEGYVPANYEAGFDLTFGWDFHHALRDVFSGAKATRLAAASQKESQGLPPKARRLRFVTNHDVSAWEGSLMELYKSPAGVRTAFAITALYGGTPLVYTGQEVAWPDRIPIFQRSKVEWDRDAAGSDWTAKLLEIRRQHPALRTGSLEDRSTDDVVAFLRKEGSDEVFVVANIRPLPAKMELGDLAGEKWTDASTGKPAQLASTLSLEPFEYRIFASDRQAIGLQFKTRPANDGPVPSLKRAGWQYHDQPRHIKAGHTTSPSKSIGMDEDFDL
jgi:glycosidase